MRNKVSIIIVSRRPDGVTLPPYHLPSSSPPTQCRDSRYTMKDVDDPFLPPIPSSVDMGHLFSNHNNAEGDGPLPALPPPDTPPPTVTPPVVPMSQQQAYPQVSASLLDVMLARHRPEHPNDTPPQQIASVPYHAMDVHSATDPLAPPTTPNSIDLPGVPLVMIPTTEAHNANVTPTSTAHLDNLATPMPTQLGALDFRNSTTIVATSPTPSTSGCVHTPCKKRKASSSNSQRGRRLSSRMCREDWRRFQAYHAGIWTLDQGKSARAIAQGSRGNAEQAD